MNVISRHKGASAGVAAFVLVLIAVTVLPVILGSSAGALSDASSCSQWSSAGQRAQNTYSRLYLNEYGALSGGAPRAGSISSAITNDCIRAAYLGEADDVSVLAAIRHEY